MLNEKTTNKSNTISTISTSTNNAGNEFLLKEISLTKEQVLQKEMEVIGLQSELSRLNQTINNSQTVLASEKKQLIQSQHEIKKQLENVLKINNKKELEIHQLKKNLVQKEENTKFLVTKIDKLKNELTATQNEKLKLEEKVNDLICENHIANKNLKNNDSEKDHLTVLLEEAKKALQAKNEKQTELEEKQLQLEKIYSNKFSEIQKDKNNLLAQIEHLSSLEEKITLLNKKNEDLESTIEDYELKIKMNSIASEKQIQFLNTKIEQKNKDIDHLNSELNQKNDELKSLSAKFENSEKAMIQQQQLAEKLNLTIKEDKEYYKNQIQNLMEEHHLQTESLENQIQFLNSKIIENENIKTNLNQSINENTQEIAEYHAQISSLKKELLTLEEKQKQQLSSFHSEIEKAETKILNKEFELKNIEKLLSQKTSDSDTKYKELIETRQLLIKKTEEFNSVKNKFENSVNENSKFSALITTLKSENTKLTESIENLNQLLNQRAIEKRELNNELSQFFQQINEKEQEIENLKATFTKELSQKDVLLYDAEQLIFEMQNEADQKLLDLKLQTQAEIDSVQSILNNQSAVISHFKDVKFPELVNKLNHTEAELKNSLALIDRQRFEIKDLNLANENLNKDLHQQKMNNETLTHDNTQLSIAVKTLNTELTRVNQVQVQLQSNIKNLNNTLVHKEEQIKELNKTIEIEQNEKMKISQYCDNKSHEFMNFIEFYENEKTKLNKTLTLLTHEIHKSISLHPLNDYLKATELELSKKELELRKLPLTSPLRSTLEKQVDQLFEQRETTKKLIADTEKHLLQQEKQINKIASYVEKMTIPTLR